MATGIGRGLALGIVYGFVVYVVFYMPLLINGFAPIMMAMMGPAAARMAPTVLVIGLGEHILYGAVLGTTVALGTRWTVALTAKHSAQ